MTGYERQLVRRLIDQAIRTKVSPPCERCGEPFEPSPRPGPAKRFCSARCRKLFHDSEDKKRRKTDPEFRALANARQRKYRQRRRARA